MNFKISKLAYLFMAITITLQSVAAAGEPRVFPSSVDSAVREQQRLILRGRNLRGLSVSFEATNDTGETRSFTLSKIINKSNRVVVEVPAVSVDTRGELVAGNQRLDLLILNKTGADIGTFTGTEIPSGFGEVTGIAGPQGPTGQDGSNGSPGPTGPQGPTGTFQTGGTIDNPTIINGINFANKDFNFKDHDVTFSFPSNFHFSSNYDKGSHITFGHTASSASAIFNMEEGFFRFGPKSAALKEKGIMNLGGSNWETLSLQAHGSSQGTGISFTGNVDDYAITSVGKNPPGGLKEGHLAFSIVSKTNPQKHEQVMAITPSGGVRFDTFLSIIPSSQPPAGVDKGTVYFDNSDALCVLVGSGWTKIAGAGTCN